MAGSVLKANNFGFQSTAKQIVMEKAKFALPYASMYFYGLYRNLMSQE